MPKQSLVSIWIMIAITMGFFGISLAGLDYTKYYSDVLPTVHWEAVPQNRVENQVVTLSTSDTDTVYLTHLCIRGQDADKFSVVSPEIESAGCGLDDGPMLIPTHGVNVVLKYDSTELGTHDNAYLAIYVRPEGMAYPYPVKFYLKATTVTPSATVELVSPISNEKLVSGTTYRVRWNASSDLVEFDLYARSESGKSGSFDWAKVNSHRITTTYFDWHVYEKPEKLDCEFKVYGYNIPGAQKPTVISDVVEWDLGYVRLIFPAGGATYDGADHCEGDLIDYMYYDGMYLTGYTPSQVYGYDWQISYNGGSSWLPSSPEMSTGNPGSFDWHDHLLLNSDNSNVKLKVRLYVQNGTVLLDESNSQTFTVKEGNQCSNPGQSKAGQPINQ